MSARQRAVKREAAAQRLHRVAALVRELRGRREADPRAWGGNVHCVDVVQSQRRSQFDLRRYAAAAATPPTLSATSSISRATSIFAAAAASVDARHRDFFLSSTRVERQLVADRDVAAGSNADLRRAGRCRSHESCLRRALADGRHCRFLIVSAQIDADLLADHEALRAGHWQVRRAGGNRDPRTRRHWNEHSRHVRRRCAHAGNLPRFAADLNLLADFQPRSAANTDRPRASARRRRQSRTRLAQQIETAGRRPSSRRVSSPTRATPTGWAC